LRFNGAIEAETLNRLVLRRLLSQTVLDLLPQVMLEKLSSSLEEDCEGSTPPLSQSTSQKVNKNLDQDVYCGGIVYHYLHSNQQSTVTQEKHCVK
jgi:hypothetical protein